MGKVIFDSFVYSAGVSAFNEFCVGVLEVEGVEVFMEWLRVWCPRCYYKDVCFLYSYYYDLDMCVDYVLSGLCVSEFLLCGFRVGWFGRGRRRWLCGVSVIEVLDSYECFDKFFVEGLVYDYSVCVVEILRYRGFGLWGCWKLCDMLVYMGVCRMEGMLLGLGVSYNGNMVDCDMGLGLGVSSMFGVVGCSRTVLGLLRCMGFSEVSFMSEFVGLGVSSQSLESLLCKWGSHYEIGSERSMLSNFLRSRGFDGVLSMF